LCGGVVRRGLGQQGSGSCAIEEDPAGVAEVLPERPRSGEQNANAARGDFDACCDLDHSRSPRTSVAFAKRIGLATLIETTTT
jgi:hypothetical protein